MRIDSPLIWRASLEARYAISPATLSGSAKFARGLCLSSRSIFGSSMGGIFDIAVFMPPGLMQLTCKPCFPYSTANDFVSAKTPALLAAYAAEYGIPASAVVEEVLIIEPPYLSK